VIHLCDVSKGFLAPGAPPRVVLRPTSVDLPSDRVLALLGGRGEGKTTVLRLLSGGCRGEQGATLFQGSFSPVVNAGRFLHASLTGIENMRFVARSQGLDEDELMLAVDAFCGAGRSLASPVRTMEPATRRGLEVAVAMVLPADCYLIDDAHALPPGLLARCIEAARARGAGLVFATAVTRLALLHADAAVVIRDATLRVFDHPAEGVAFQEAGAFQQAGDP
jgi:capsular polysaccharide transport system ATP-binding protein